MAKKKKANKNKPHGHYCWVCGEHKANEKFSGRGHATHMCRQCHALPVAERNKMVALRRVDGMALRYISEQEIKWLRKKMKNAHPEVMEAARSVYDMKFSHYDIKLDKIAALKTPVIFSELDDEEKAETLELLEELIDSFFLGAYYLPTDEDRDKILSELSEQMADTLNRWKPEPYDVTSQFDPRFNFGSEVSFDERISIIKETLDADAEDYDPYAEPEEPKPMPQKELITDAELISIFDKIIVQIAAEAEADGMPIPTFIETLMVAETERLTIRRFYGKDLNALCNIMSKPEVMYAWEHGFHKRKVRKWLNNQHTRCHKDGYGYFAVTLKDTGKLIGQAGLMKLELNGENVVEIGYIFDNNVWGHGYAVEASRACVDLAFGRFKQDKLYATIRPENTASVKLALKLGMRKIGEIVKTYKEKDMPHDIYLLENNTGV